jgi:collagenase-like PrtC family protease
MTDKRTNAMELVCPAGSLPALKAAVDHGADAVYLGLRDHTNARHFAGLNFDEQTLDTALSYAHNRGARVFMAVNTYPRPQGWPRWQRAVDIAADAGVDALIAADIGVLDHAAEKHPQLRRHLSVQGSATNYEAIRFYHEQLGITRAVVPRVLSLQQVETLVHSSPVEIETFGFGSLCVMVEGRCLLSSYLTGESPNTCGACSPAKAVEWRESADRLETRLGGIVIDRFGPSENAGYPTLCKGRFAVNGNTYYALEEPTSLNVLDLLPQLQNAGVAAIKIEGRQRSPAYVAQVTAVWRAALDACAADPNNYSPTSKWVHDLSKLAEGTQTTLGALHRPWQ